MGGLVWIPLVTPTGGWIVLPDMFSSKKIQYANFYAICLLFIYIRIH